MRLALPTTSGALRKSLVLSTEAKAKLRAVILLSMPTIVGTGCFLAGVILSKLNLNPPPADVDPWRAPTYVQSIVGATAFGLYLALYFGAVLGPLLLPFAGYEAFGLTRAVGLRSSVTIWAWTHVILGVAATVLFWGWLSTQDIYI
jgi:hypothetical protein